MTKSSPKQSGEISSSKLTTSDIGVQFLLADFNSIRTFKEQSVSIGDKRVDIFITLSSALTGGLGLLSQTGIDLRTFLFIALCGAFGLLVIGLVTFYQVVDRDILIVDYIHAINRIRGFFAENAPHIQPYLLMPTSHIYPKYNWQSSNRRIPMVINGLSAGALCALLTLLIRNLTIPDFVSVLSLAIAFLITFSLQEIYSHRIFKRAESKAHQSRTENLFESHEQFRESFKTNSRKL
jgi:hypothetical protein